MNLYKYNNLLAVFALWGISLQKNRCFKALMLTSFFTNEVFFFIEESSFLKNDSSGRRSERKISIANIVTSYKKS